MSKFQAITKKLETAVYSLSLSTAVLAPQMMVFADTTGNNIVKSVLSIVGTIAIIPAIFTLIMGVLHYSTANSEGDGPATSKAIKQIISGVMIGVLAAFLKLASGENNVIGNLVDSMFDL